MSEANDLIDNIKENLSQIHAMFNMAIAERDEAVELLRKHQRKDVFHNGELMDIVCVECGSNMMFNLKHDPDCRLKLLLDKHRIP